EDRGQGDVPLARLRTLRDLAPAPAAGPQTGSSLMGVLSKAVDWVLMRDLPAARIDRQQSAGMHQRAAMPRSISGSVPAWQSGKPTFPADNVLVLTRDGYRKTSTAFACINIIADAVAEATLRVWEDQGAGKREEALDH